MLGISKKVCCLGVFLGYIGGGMFASRGEVAMGGGSVAPILLSSLADWQAAHAILSDSGFGSAAAVQFTGSNFMGPSEWYVESGVYQGSFAWCSGDRVTWSYNPATGVVTTGTKSFTCDQGQSPRLPSALAYNFLVYVLEQSPASLVNQLGSASIVDFVVTSSGSAYTVEFTFDASVTYTKASATYSNSSGFGALTVW